MYRSVQTLMPTQDGPATRTSGAKQRYNPSATMLSSAVQMPIIGAHMLLYSQEPDALRATLHDAFGFPSVDAGGGWLIFALPPSELAVHPAGGPPDEGGTRHQVSFMCDDLAATINALRAKGVTFEGEPAEQRWGRSIMMTLPGGVKIMLYQPRHATALAGTSANQPNSGLAG